MDPISSATASPDPAIAADAAATANTQADFQQAFDRVLSSVGTGVVSIALEDLIQISQEDL
jgi:hypothetical protein